MRDYHDYIFVGPLWVLIWPITIQKVKCDFFWRLMNLCLILFVDSYYSDSAEKRPGRIGRTVKQEQEIISFEYVLASRIYSAVDVFSLC